MGAPPDDSIPAMIHGTISQTELGDDFAVQVVRPDGVSPLASLVDLRTYVLEDSPQLDGLNLGHATDTTITRSAAGKIAVEGKAVPLMSGAFDATLAGLTAARTYTLPNVSSTIVTSATVPRFEGQSETVAASAFTDGGGTTGTYVLSMAIPAGAVLLRSKIIVGSGFIGDTTCTLTIGDGSDVDRYHTGTPSIFATAATGVQSGVPSGNLLLTALNTPTLTITSSTDIGLVIAEAGSVTVSIYYLVTD